MNKKDLSYVVSLVLSLMSFNCFAAFPVTDIMIKKLTPVDVFFVGKTEAVEKVKLGFDIQGKIEKTKKYGDLVFDSMYNSKGEQIRKGTVVASLYKQRQQFELNAARMKLKIADYNLQQDLDDYKRNDVLVKRNAVSRKVHITSKLAVMKSKMNLDDAENSVAQAEYNLAATEIIAPFTGIVSKVLRGKNMSTGDDTEVIEITKMSPILVKIPFASEIIERLGKDAVVKVYPPGPEKPVSAWIDYSPFGINSIFVYVANKIISAKALTPEQKKLPRVYEVYPVMRLAEASLEAILPLEENAETYMKMPLFIPVRSVYKDKHGDYVFLAEGQKAMSLDQGIAKEFRVKKTYVSLGEMMKTVQLGHNTALDLISLKDSSLKEGDVVVLYGQKNIKDGDRVVRDELRWLFYPDEEVRVEIPAISKPGFYVPKEAIIHQDTSSNFVYLIENDKAKLRQVELIGLCPDYYSIEGEGIKEGARIIVPQSKEEIGQLYDGADVLVNNTLSPPLRIEHKRVYNVLVPIDKLEFFAN